MLECNCVVGQVLGNIYGDKRILHLLMLLIIIDFKMALSITLLHAPIISLSLSLSVSSLSGFIHLL